MGLILYKNYLKFYIDTGAHILGMNNLLFGTIVKGQVRTWYISSLISLHYIAQQKLVGDV